MPCSRRATRPGHERLRPAATQRGVRGGLRTEVTFNSNRKPPLFGDTLRVILRATKPPGDLEDRSYSRIVAATVQCILLNAAPSPAIKCVALRVDGEADYRKYGGVFATAEFRNGPRKREFKVR